MLYVWELKLDMQFNTSKCQVVQVTGSKSPYKSEYILHGQVLDGIMIYRNGSERTETDGNGPKRTFVDTEPDSEYRNGLSGYRNGPEQTETDFSGYRNGLT